MEERTAKVVDHAPSVRKVGVVAAVTFCMHVQARDDLSRLY